LRRNLDLSLADRHVSVAILPFVSKPRLGLALEADHSRSPVQSASFFPSVEDKIVKRYPNTFQVKLCDEGVEFLYAFGRCLCG